MSYRVHPFWWPVLAPLSPALALLLRRKSKAFQAGKRRAESENAQKMARAEPLNLPELDRVKLTAVVEAKTAAGFLGDAAVSYLLETDRGRLLFDVGFGPGSPTFGHNWQRLGLSMENVDAVAISHLHLDHMGGFAAHWRREVMVPAEAKPDRKMTCWVPEPCASPFFSTEEVDAPMLLPAGLATTGPLARMLFFLGYTYEQSLIAHVKGRGLVVVIGCGHPTLEIILSVIRRISDAPIFAVVGGLHFPVTASRAPRVGLQVERIFGTGKTWNDPINDRDLDLTIGALRRARPERLLISAHDSCDHALSRMEREVGAEFDVLRAGRSYDLGGRA